jgi:hypothetical protein
MDGRRLARAVEVDAGAGRAVGDRNCVGGSGVVGESGCEVNPL